MTENKYTFEQVEEWVKVGEDRERERILEILEAERKRTGLGFIQYGTILEKIGE